jgi:putative PIG3 family NAD(P)H quinone oxidoreductase
MRAVTLNGAGGPEVLDIAEVADVRPSRNEIRVRVVASALNRADVSQRLGRYPAPPGYPQDIPGLEYAGVVDSLGEGASLFNADDRVMGITGGGAHAEFVVVHEREAMPVPEVLTFEEAAAVPEVFLTAYDAVFDQMKVSAGETLLIHAAGSGVGTAAVQLSAVAGVRTIGTSRSQAKLERSRSLGMNEGVHATDSGWAARVREMTEGQGVNAILDLVGASYLAGNLEALAFRGRMISVGLTAGSRAELDMSVVMRKRLTIIGTVLRARPIEEKIATAQRFSRLMLPLFQDGRLKAIVDSVHDFSEIRAAHALMESNQTFGKIVLRWS